MEMLNPFTFESFYKSKLHFLLPPFQALENSVTLVFPNCVVKHKCFTFVLLFLGILNQIMNTSVITADGFLQNPENDKA
ncbi:hypothetical protein V1477_021063 [Vespula maculifrons]|uniref:Uncharacterized protein n=1 Tax=Vespula maculifrons TaxID=7453 RepID=A0ABD2AHP8_VESMC